MSRNLQYLNNNRIIYRRYSPDKPTEEYSWGWYYADGTYGYYSLFNSKAKINTIKSLKWHLLVLWYLNPDMDKQKFINLTEVITNKENEFVTCREKTQTDPTRKPSTQLSSQSSTQGNNQPNNQPRTKPSSYSSI